MNPTQFEELIQLLEKFANNQISDYLAVAALFISVAAFFKDYFTKKNDDYKNYESIGMNLSLDAEFRNRFFVEFSNKKYSDEEMETTLLEVDKNIPYDINMTIVNTSRFPIYIKGYKVYYKFDNNNEEIIMVEGMFLSENLHNNYLKLDTYEPVEVKFSLKDYLELFKKNRWNGYVYTTIETSTKEIKSDNIVLDVIKTNYTQQNVTIVSGYRDEDGNLTNG